MIQLMMMAMFLMVAAPAFAGSAVSVYNCQQADDVSEADVIATAKLWLADSKGVKGGENLQVRVMFPVAAALGDNDFLFIVIAPSFSEWGVFQDNNSAASEAGDAKKYAHIAECDDSALWESFGG